MSKNPIKDKIQSIIKDIRFPNRTTKGTEKNIVQYIPMIEDVAIKDFSVESIVKSHCFSVVALFTVVCWLALILIPVTQPTA